MPILHRNIGATGHAWADDNGKIVLRANVPSHQQVMRFTVEWSGDIDLTPLFQPGRILEDYDPTNFNSVLFPASNFNAQMTAHDFGADAFYNDCGFPNLEIALNGRWTDDDAGGNALRSWRNPDFCCGIVWDAASWHWACRFSLFPQLWQGGVSWQTGTLFNGDAYHGDAYALYESSPSVQNIRAGNGVTLTLKGLFGDWNAGADECLAGTSFTLRAQ